ncbi:DUF1153 domain-containing protein [Porphyrobacter sp. ULC335]|uniref:DUF1153 domain-containing protein n=1 Tax=Porphyrobacter sp. ULC335 TaxID=2854260 RepID=UPI00221EB122|nr:DUF1153 domain-containing protein [Porphyrobacter sp. ULC335]UYV15288.1 DUF1153 domain-containing protein [Porphyrobacter sp. ULC335]
MAYPRNISIADAIKSYNQLPRTHRVHWSKARKDEVVRAVHDRAISFHEARERYLLSRSEFEQWEADYLASGGETTGMQDA